MVFIVVGCENCESTRGLRALRKVEGIKPFTPHFHKSPLSLPVPAVLFFLVFDGESETTAAFSSFLLGRKA